jgi:hypothetical protein
LSQFGSLACENPQAGKVIDTLVLCQTSESRRTDHGGGSLTAVVGDRWPGTLLAMSCSTENPPKERPTVQLPANPGAPTPVGGGLGRRIRPEDAADEASPEAADSTEVETPTAPLRFVWRLEVTDPGRHSDAVVLDPRHDTIEHGLDGWSCSYAIHDVPSSTGAPAEAGSLVCDSGEGVTFATAVVCTPTPDSPNVCQAGSLRFGAGEDGIRALMLTCKDTANPGCF